MSNISHKWLKTGKNERLTGGWAIIIVWTAEKSIEISTQKREILLIIKCVTFLLKNGNNSKK
jgi:hypothetical protein